MNDFKKSLLASTAKVTDEEITKRIGIALESLKDKVEGDAYKQQIQDRKRKIKNLLVDFNTNRDIIEGKYILDENKSKKNTSVIAVDKVISNTINTKLNMFYEEIKSNNKEDTDVKQAHTLCVILERQCFIGELLKDFDGKMQFLQNTILAKEDLRDVGINEK